MFGFGSGDASYVLAAVSKSQAVIEFDLRGNILSANENFCKAVGYSLDEIVGRHHRMFCTPGTTDSADYNAFWSRLGAGTFDAGTYKRIGKGGREIWIQASYNPVFKRGKPFKVVKFAADITAVKEKAVEDAGKLRYQELSSCGCDADGISCPACCGRFTNEMTWGDIHAYTASIPRLPQRRTCRPNTTSPRRRTSVLPTGTTRARFNSTTVAGARSLLRQGTTKGCDVQRAYRDR